MEYTSFTSSVIIKMKMTHFRKKLKIEEALLLPVVDSLSITRIASLLTIRLLITFMTSLLVVFIVVFDCCLCSVMSLYVVVPWLNKWKQQ